MMKRALALAAILAGCSLQSAPETARVQPAQAYTAQPAAFSHQPGQYNRLHCERFEAKMEVWGYRITCDNDFGKVTLDHSEWAPESVVYDGSCNERLFYESAEERIKWIDYGCDSGLDAYLHWTYVQMENYGIYVPDAVETDNISALDFGFVKSAIGADRVDAVWRFRYHVPQRNGGN